MSNGNAVMGCVVVIPALIYYAKALRIEGRDQFDTMVKIKHRSLFWERGNEFSKLLTGHIHDSIAEETRYRATQTEVTVDNLEDLDRINNPMDGSSNSGGNHSETTAAAVSSKSRSWLSFLRK